MSTLNTVAKVILVWVALVVAGTLAGILVPLHAPIAPHLTQWWLASNFLISAALAVPGMRSEWRGVRLGAGLAAVPLFVGLADVLEGAVFMARGVIPWDKLALQTTVTYILMVPVMGFVYGRRKASGEETYRPFQSQSASEKVWKFALSDAAYVFFYFLAGAIIFPYVRDFYATQTLPSHAKIAVLQLFVRGPVFVLLCLLLVRMLRLSRAGGALTTGLVFTLISGVAPLIIPNPYLPEAVRWVHFCEVTSSNLVFGAFIAWLWGTPKPSALKALSQPA